MIKRLIDKVRQIYFDHKAMSMVRDKFGDVCLTACVGEQGKLWHCSVFQNAAIEAQGKDPSVAIIDAIDVNLVLRECSSVDTHKNNNE